MILSYLLCLLKILLSIPSSYSTSIYIPIYPLILTTTDSSFSTTFFFMNEPMLIFKALERETMGNRVWQFQGSGFADENDVEITFIILIPYSISFETPLSGIITTSSMSYALNAYPIKSIVSIDRAETIRRYSRSASIFF